MRNISGFDKFNGLKAKALISARYKKDHHFVKIEDYDYDNYDYDQCCGAGAALFGPSRSREKRGDSGSSSTAQAPAMTPC